MKYKSIRKSALGYKKLAAEREKRLLEEKESHKQHLDDVQFKMAKTIHKREAEINAKIAEIEKCNNEKLKVIMMLQRTAESSGANNKPNVNNLNNHTKAVNKTSNKKCTNENVNPESQQNGDVEEIVNSKPNNITSKKNNKVNNLVANNDRKAVTLKKKKTEL